MASGGSMSEYDEIKIKLRIDDDSMRDEIQLYMHQIDNLINNRLRAKLGEYNIYGQAIILPLTFQTIPIIPLELKAIASDLVVAKIRLQNSEKPLLWDAQVKVLDNYLDMVYGWTQHGAFQPVRTLTISPASGIIGSTITVSGTNFQPTTKLTISFGNTNPTTTPATVITSSTGVFSATFLVPTNHSDSSYEIKIADEMGGKAGKYQVTS